MCVFTRARAYVGYILLLLLSSLHTVRIWLDGIIVVACPFFEQIDRIGKSVRGRDMFYIVCHRRGSRRARVIYYSYAFERKMWYAHSTNTAWSCPSSVHMKKNDFNTSTVVFITITWWYKHFFFKLNVRLQIVTYT